ncbi:MAG TPA: MBL fold metallo-hydrolase, partial [Dehalococcoidia bacterium]|nr:MBL fold metallo-hydrolase [Dehalococcoidia bacterium]
MLIRFWGTRGSIPAPGRRTAFFGGNTSCVELQSEDGQVIMLDCGTGARSLGLDLLGRGSALPPIHLLVTHTHWDHIQGFPFFVPAYVPGGHLTVYGARGLDRTLEGSLAGQMQHTYFPVQLGELRADINFAEIGEERFPLGRYRVTTQFLNHTATTVGYRIEAGDLTIVYATDHEPFWWTAPRPSSPHRFDHPGEERHLEFVAGADLLIHDAQYIDREYPTKRGWGHSTIEYVTDLAIRAGVKQLALFHHDPVHPDAWIRNQIERARRRVQSQGADLQIIAAAEGLDIHLPEAPAAVDVDRAENDGQQAFVIPRGRVLVVGSDREAVKEVGDALALDRYQITVTEDTELTVQAPKVRPHVMIFVGSDGEAGLLEQVDRVRAFKWGSQVPILVLPGDGRNGAGRLIGGLTDVVAGPFSPPMIRARTRSWLSRTGTFTPRRSTRREHRLFGLSGSSTSGLLKGLPLHERVALLAGAMTRRFRPAE